MQILRGAQHGAVPRWQRLRQPLQRREIGQGLRMVRAAHLGRGHQPRAHRRCVAWRKPLPGHGHPVTTTGAVTWLLRCGRRNPWPA